MKKLLALLSAFILLFVAGCSGTGGSATSDSSGGTDDIEINAQADEKVNFKGYKSYAWFAEVGILRDPEGKWEPPEFDADSEIKFLVNRELRNRGMNETNNNPDVLVAYALGVDMAALKLNKTDDPKKFDIENQPKGALIVVLIEPTTFKPIWAGVATAQKKGKTTTEMQKKRLDYVVTGMLDKLPK